tara:strand:- start:1221 stop:1739 length:519 start_codon:yes stop_codon:yes gene_type:complete
MKKEIFAIPVFEDTIDVERLKLPDLECEPTWDAGIPTTFCKQLELCEDAYKALGEVVDRNLYEANLMGANARFGHLWYNKYDEHHYQDIHIHPKCQWSFIVYIDVYAKTSFMNPSFRDIQNQLAQMVEGFPLDYKPDLGPGSMIIFPSFLMHSVNSGNKGRTLSGNIYMDYQ